MTSDNAIHGLSRFADSEIRMPALFVGHGSPMNAIEDNEFSRQWADIGKMIPKPEAILCISAHWETKGTLVTAMEHPKMIYDFAGFPQALYGIKYPARGAPELADIIKTSLHKTPIYSDLGWGLDHGAWSVLCRMFPDADIPVVQLSLDFSKEPEFHYDLAKELKLLRDKGILILGSGNMVHNLRMMVWQDQAYDWAVEFDETLKQLILSGDHEAIVHYRKIESAPLAVPTNEHYLPLLYILALQDKDDKIRFFADKITLGSISMRSLMIG